MNSYCTDWSTEYLHTQCNTPLSLATSTRTSTDFTIVPGALVLAPTADVAVFAKLSSLSPPYGRWIGRCRQRITQRCRQNQQPASMSSTQSSAPAAIKATGPCHWALEAPEASAGSVCSIRDGVLGGGRGGGKGHPCTVDVAALSLSPLVSQNSRLGNGGGGANCMSSHARWRL